MKPGTNKIALLTALLFAISSHVALAQRLTRQESDKSDLPEREQFHETYRLAAGARLEVININGPLEIQTINGDTAEVTVVRSARTREDLEYRKIIVEQKGNTFRVYAQEPEEPEARNVTVRHRAVIKVPRPSALLVKNVNGSARIGDIDGPIMLANINGELSMGRASDFADFANINGNMAFTLGRLGQRGIRARNINGNMNIRFIDRLNADMEVRSFNGLVNPKVSSVTVRKAGRSSFLAQFGSGGAPISMTQVNGVITIHDASFGDK
jgi:hypothetical protein